jgi:hypothetical protein
MPKAKKAGGVAQVMGHLPSKHGSLSSYHNTGNKGYFLKRLSYKTGRDINTNRCTNLNIQMKEIKKAT